MSHDPEHAATMQRMQIDLAEAGARIVTLERTIEAQGLTIRTQESYIQQLRDEKRVAEEALRKELARRDEEQRAKKATRDFDTQLRGN